MFFVFIYVHWCPAQFQYHRLLLLYTNSMTRVTSKKEKRTLPENTGFTPIFLFFGSCCWIDSYLCVEFCRLVFVFLTLLWPLCFLAFGIFNLFLFSIPRGMMVWQELVGIINTHVISAYHNQRWEFESRLSEVYSIQHYVIELVSDLLQIGGFFRVLLLFPPPIKLTATM